MPDTALDPDTPPAGKRRRFTWTWPRLLALSFLVIVLAIGGLLLYDEPLRPYDDLELPLIAAVPAAENGWDFLREKWQALPVPTSAVKDKLLGLLTGETCWDETDPHLAAATREADLRITELRTALALPVWQAPEPGSFRQLDGSLAWVVHGSRPIDARYFQLLQNHSLPEAFDLAALQLKLAHAYRRNPGTILHFLVGQSLLRKWITSIPALLAVAGPEDDPLIVATQRELKTDWYNPEMLRQIIFRESRLFRASVMTDTASEMGTSPLKLRFLFKRNRTINDQSTILRRLMPLLLRPMDSHSDSIRDIRNDFNNRPDFRKFSDKNYVGSQSLEGPYHVVELVDSAARTTLALQRAMNVRIALHRWKLAHGTLPVILTELVPEFLPAVPVDPFDGKPLRWDPTRFGGLIYSAGMNLEDNPAAPFNAGTQSFGWTDTYMNNPAVRLALPSSPGKSPSKAAPSLP